MALGALNRRSQPIPIPGPSLNPALALAPAIAQSLAAALTLAQDLALTLALTLTRCEEPQIVTPATVGWRLFVGCNPSYPDYHAEGMVGLTLTLALTLTLTF